MSLKIISATHTPHPRNIFTCEYCASEYIVKEFFLFFLFNSFCLSRFFKSQQNCRQNDYSSAVVFCVVCCYCYYYLCAIKGIERRNFFTFDTQSYPDINILLNIYCIPLSHAKNTLKIFHRI